MSVEQLKNGIFPVQHLEMAISDGVITAEYPIEDGQLQPASLDLRLGSEAWRVQASFLPGENMFVDGKLAKFGMHKIDLTNGAVLERGCVYIVKLQERLNLPAGTSAIANPKSSTGRLDIFTRLITDGAREFESVADGYEGPLYAEISPRTFSILVRPGSRLSQLRLRRGVGALSDHVMETLQSTVGLVHGVGLTDIRDGVALSVNLDPDSKSGVVGWRARKNAGLIDVDAPLANLLMRFGNAWHRLILPLVGWCLIRMNSIFSLAVSL